MRRVMNPRARRAAIANVRPQLDGGRFPIRRLIGEALVVEADVFLENQEDIAAILQFRRQGEPHFKSVPMLAIGNDRWRGIVRFDATGIFQYTVAATSALVADQLSTTSTLPDYGSYSPLLEVIVDPDLASCGAWYQVFPRSCSREAGRHGTFDDLERQLRRIAAMDFDVAYIPPIHPIGTTRRKGKNNAPAAGLDEPGSPWAVGAKEGGHKSVHPQLGTVAEFSRLVRRSRAMGLEIALDLAFHCSPDHPYVREHPDWFRRHTDGSFECPIDPPFVYQDVVAFDFACSDWLALWTELYSIVDFWIRKGIRVLRMDNPHSKPFPFWEFLLHRLSSQHPEVVVLSEGLTRPRVMHHLAKLGFSQSYDHFPWKSSKAELVEYYSNLVVGDPVEYFRPILWANTAQVLPRMLQVGGVGSFVVRATLAAMLGASYGIYGPPFELCLDQTQEPAGQEYRDSEQYELRSWDTRGAERMERVLSQLNRIRRENPALQQNRSLTFHSVDNDDILVFSKTSEDGENRILVVVNLDPCARRSGWVTLELEALGLGPTEPFQVGDLLDGSTYRWFGARNYVELDPGRGQHAHVFRLSRSFAL